MTPPAMMDPAPVRTMRGGSQDHIGKDNEEGMIPSCQIRVNVSASDRDDQLVHVVQALCPLLDQSDGEYQSKPLLGGLSNELFVVSKGSQAVLVRIHPEDECIVNHDEEFRILAWLSQQGDAPGLYGKFSNGRIEEFLHGYFPLSNHDMGNYTLQLASHMANLHNKVVPSGVLSRTSESVWTRVDSWFEKAFELEGKRDPELCNMLEQWKWVRDELSDPSLQDPIVSFCRQTVFCHMDLQSLNILRNETVDALRIIDYEYSGMHPRAVDIANTWLEYCDMNNLKADYEGEYPTVEQQNAFLRVYLSLTQPEWFGDADEEMTLRRLRIEIGKHTLVSHVGWAVWGVVLSHRDSIGFNYREYARLRMKGFHFFRAKFFYSTSSSLIK